MNKKLEVKQTGFKDCAVACLLSIIRYYNGSIAKEELEYIIKTSSSGTSAYHMIEGMKTLGFNGYGINQSYEEILTYQDALPFIAHVVCNQMYHYIVIYEINIKRKYFKIMDPNFGMRKISFDEFKSIYLGVTLHFYPEGQIPKLKDKISFISYIIKNCISQKKIIILIFLLSIIIILFSIINNYYFKILIDYIISNFTLKIFLLVIITFIIIIILKNMFDYIRSKLLIKINSYVSLKITNESVRHILCLPYHYFKNKPTGEIVSRIDDLNNFKDLISNLILNIFVNILLIFISSIFLYIINPTLLFYSLIVIVIYVLIVLIYSKVFKNKIYDIQVYDAEYNKNLIETLENYETIKNLNLINSFIHKLEIKYISFIHKLKKFQCSYNNQNLIKNLINDIGIILIIGVGSYFVITNKITIGDLIVFNTLVLYFLEPIKQLLDMEPNIRYAKNSFERISELLLIKEESYNSEEKTLIDGNIKIKNISYSYNDVDNIFNEVTLEIKKGQKILIYGQSGKGKSTLMKILLKYITNYNGNVLIDNKNIKDINTDIIRNSFLYVSQNEKLFCDTIENNIKLDRLVDEKIYEDIVKICKVDKIIDSKKSRYLFLVEENGFNLSGGERQKVILARALLKNTNYIILDEALSEVDLEEENEIIDNLFQYFKNKTIIYISHKDGLINKFENKFCF